jgi:hypothetical protein
MWETACGSTLCTVASPPSDVDHSGEIAYRLTTDAFVDPAAAEQAMRAILDEGGFSFRLMRSS